LWGVLYPCDWWMSIALPAQTPENAQYHREKTACHFMNNQWRAKVKLWGRYGSRVHQQQRTSSTASKGRVMQRKKGSQQLFRHLEDLRGGSITHRIEGQVRDQGKRPARQRGARCPDPFRENASTRARSGEEGTPQRIQGDGEFTRNDRAAQGCGFRRISLLTGPVLHRPAPGYKDHSHPHQVTSLGCAGLRAAASSSTRGPAQSCALGSALLHSSSRARWRKNKSARSLLQNRLLSYSFSIFFPVTAEHRNRHAYCIFQALKLCCSTTMV